MKRCLSSRERVRLALAHQETDRIPFAMVCSGINPPARRELEIYLRRERNCDLQTILDDLIDIKYIDPAYCGPPRAAGEDIWGVRRTPVSYGAGTYDEITHYPLAGAAGLDDLKKHAWPSTKLFDYAALADRIAAAQRPREHCLMAHNGNVFESSWYMRGFERIFIDLVEQLEVAHYIFEHATNFFIEHFRKILAAAKGQIDLVFTADDIAGQNGLLMSLEMWEEFIKPYHRRLNAAIHEFGAKVIYHSDGAVMAAVDGLIDMGIDVLQALQFDAAGMDAAALKAGYGERLCFEGGVSVQKTLPFGTPEDVRRETEYLIRTLGKNGGYILGPSHAIQAGTPPQNIMAMLDAAREYYPFR